MEQNIGDEIMEFFEIGNAGNFISLVYAKHFKFPSSTYDVFAKWNFLETYVDKYDNPNRSDYELLYLAEMLGFYQDDITEYYQINKQVLKDFNISSESQLKYIIKQLNVA